MHTFAPSPWFGGRLLAYLAVLGLAGCMQGGQLIDPMQPADGGTAQCLLDPARTATDEDFSSISLWFYDHDRRLHFLRNDGLVLDPFEPFANLDIDGSINHQVTQRGGYIAVMSHLIQPPNDPALGLPRVSYSLLNNRGQELWTLEEERLYPSAIFIGDEGLVAVDRGWQDFDASNPRLNGWVIDLHGDTTELVGLRPIGTPRTTTAGAKVPVCNEEERCGWVLLNDDTQHLQAWADDTGLWAWHEQDGVQLRMGVNDEGWATVIADDGSTQTRSQLQGAFLWGGMDWTPWLQLISNYGSRYLMVGNPTEPSTLWLVDTSDNEAAQMLSLDQSFPKGYRRIDPNYCPPQAAGVDGEGRLYVPLRNEHSARVFVAAAPYTDWAVLGLPATEVLGIRTEVRADTTFVWGESGLYTYCQPHEWGEVPANVERTLARDSLQALHSDGVTTEVFTSGEQGWSSPPVASPDGGCLATQNQIAGSFIVKQLFSENQQEILGFFGGWL